MDTISSQWQRFSVYIGSVPGQVGRKAYGLTFLDKGSRGIEYLTGVEVSDRARLPAGFSCVSIPEQRYAVFVHAGHVSALRETCGLIGAQWLPEWGQPIMPSTHGTPDFFERYTKDFNPRTGMGGIEIWIPIQ
jgi:AraC family transcriptional regulator